MKSKIKANLPILLITLLAFFLRIYGLNWDQGQHLHPDERMITMVAEKIAFPKDLRLLFSPDSTLNPKFFAYGSFPIYLLRLISYLLSFIDTPLGTYAQMNLVGRLLSALFDSLSVILVFCLAQSIFKNKTISFFSALFYALSFFPIQLSHFYAVDTPLNFFILLTLYHIILFYEKQSFKNAFFIGLSLALSLATKISATLLIISLGTGLIVGFLLSLKKQIFGLEISFLSRAKIYLKRSFLPQYWTQIRLKKLRSTLFFALFISLSVLLFFFLFQPFAFFDFPLFLKQINEQQIMTRDAFVFPYTLQYVATTPYLYQLKNIFLWGQGPFLSTLSFLGLFYTLFHLIKGLFSPGNEESEGKQLIVFSFFLSYFAITGAFAVKFMRYCLPLYPLLSITAAYFLVSLYQKTSRPKTLLIFFSAIFLAHLFYLASFFSIYQSPNTRVQATAWIEKNIPPDSLILREHWDDGLPLGYHPEYQLAELPLYESDTNSQKWTQINSLLLKGDYLILASNRLYTPLTRLTDCSKLPSGRCYAQTAQYYQNLFAGHLAYQKVAEFTSYPSLFGLTLNDQSADESFTVYDHPKVTIFKRTSP